jgi:chaperone modulatory protein CbpM
MNRKLNLEEAARESRLEVRVLVTFIENEWLTPASRSPLELDEEDLCRANLIRELREDLGVNDEAVPIILRLIDRVHRLRLEFKRSRG